jgi:citrate synthase
MKAPETQPVQTMGYSTPDRIIIRGHDLCEDLIGKVDFGAMVFLEIVGRLPSDEEAAMVNAVLVTLAEHGVTANSIATRLTHHAAPEALQGAVAAGLLGAGSTFLGAIEECAHVLQDLAQGEGELEDRVRAYVDAMRTTRSIIPGIGHPVHKPHDPRTELLFSMADRLGFPGAHRAAAKELRRVAEEVYDRVLPVNADGAIAAVLSDVGFPWQVCRGFAVIGRSGGLVGHVMEESRRPVARHIWSIAEETLEYADPEPLF